MRSLVVVLGLGFFLSAAVTSRSQTASSYDLPPSISLWIAVVHDTVKAGDPIPIKVTLSNLLTRDLTIPREIHGHDFQMDVRDENGNLAADTRYGYVWNGHVANPDPARVNPADLSGNGASMTVKANSTQWWMELNATKLYEMSKPGKYNIRVQTRDPENHTLTAKSNVITVTVESK